MTHEQQKLLIFIRDYVRSNCGVSPSYDEMLTALDLKSKNGINRIVIALEQRGLIRRRVPFARSIYPTRAGLALLDGNLLKAADEMEASNG